MDEAQLLKLLAEAHLWMTHANEPDNDACTQEQYRLRIMQDIEDLFDPPVEEAVDWNFHVIYTRSTS